LPSATVVDEAALVNVITRLGKWYLLVTNNSRMYSETAIFIYPRRAATVIIKIPELNQTWVLEKLSESRQLRLHIKGEKRPLTIVITVAGRRYVIHTRFAGPSAAKEMQLIEMTLKELMNMLMRIKLETLVKAGAAVVIGVAIAVVSRRHMHIIELRNPVNMLMIFSACVIAFTLMHLLKEHMYVCAAYAVLPALGYATTFNAVHPGDEIALMHISMRDRRIALEPVVLYKVEDRMAVALQSARECLRRLFGRHTYIKIPKTPPWELRSSEFGDYDLYIVEKLRLRKVRRPRYEIAEKLEGEEEERPSLRDRIFGRYVEERELEVEPAEIHTHSAILVLWRGIVSVFEDLRSKYEQALEELLRYRLTFVQRVKEQLLGTVEPVARLPEDIESALKTFREMLMQVHQHLQAQRGRGGGGEQTS